MTFKETITTLLIMIVITVMVTLFNYWAVDPKEQNEANIEAFINELNSEAIIYTNY